MDTFKLNVINGLALIASMFLTQIEAVLSILVLASALTYNIIRLYKQNKK